MNGKRIMTVEDNPVIAAYYSAVVRAAGATHQSETDIKTLKSPEYFGQCLTNFQPDLIIFDHHLMPDQPGAITGMDLARSSCNYYLNRNMKRPKHLMITAYAGDVRRIAGSDSPWALKKVCIDRMIEKEASIPIGAIPLIEIIEEMLQEGDDD